MNIRSQNLDRTEIIDLYKNGKFPELISLANKTYLENYGNKVWIRGLIEFSNFCNMNCTYCGIRMDNRKINRYRLEETEIINIVRQGMEAGFKTFVLQSGEDNFYTIKVLCRLIEKIRDIASGSIAITLSCGLKTKSQFKELKKAGCNRYLMRFETSDEALFSGLKNGLSLKDRLKGLYYLKELGFETGSGYMVGLPGETGETRINNALLCADLELDMIGIGPFIPHPYTPLYDSAVPCIDETVRSTALLRLLLPKSNIPATTAAGSIHPSGREKMLEAGANVLMPNITPAEHKKDYTLYPGKICIEESGLQCLECLEIRVRSINKTIDMGRGDSKNKGTDIGRKDLLWRGNR